MTSITPQLIRAALAHIPATLAREEWARVGMAIKSEFPDATGQDLFETWSATADGHDPRATRSTWRSIKAGGGVGIGTLLHLAKEHGFVLPKPDHAATGPSPEVLAQREREKAERQRAEQASQQRGLAPGTHGLLFHCYIAEAGGMAISMHGANFYGLSSAGSPFYAAVKNVISRGRLSLLFVDLFLTG